jgi:hypothetical protein
LKDVVTFETCRTSSTQQAARLKRLARQLNAVEAVAEDDLDLIALEIGRGDKSIPSSERHGHFIRKFIEERDFLNHLRAAAESLTNQLKRGRGQPRNLLAYLVLKDIAAIFEWLTGLQARREVDRKDGHDTGAFYHFCEAIWLPVFGVGLDGLPAAMKNWAVARRKYNEKSALIANIAMRNPPWRVLDR